MTEAKARLAAYGDKEVNRFFDLDTKSGTALDVAEGLILLQRYQAAGDDANVVRTIRKLRNIGTSLGQGVQAFSLLSRMTPEGMLLYAQSELDDVTAKLTEKNERCPKKGLG